MVKIFCSPTHTTKERMSGVDFIRLIQPMTLLDKEDGFKVEIYDAKELEPASWSKVTSEFNVIYFNYMTHDWGYAAMGMLSRQRGVKMVMDIDDNLWNILPDNSAYNVFKKGSQGLHIVTSIINDVDYVTCTNNYLRNAILNNTYKRYEQVKVFPNYIDLDLYKYRCEFRDMPDIVLVHFGSTTHFTSLQNEQFANALDKLMREYPNLKFRTIGSFFGEYKNRWGARYEYTFGDQDVLKWVEKMPKLMDEADIIVAPLSENVYNRSKSSCKFLEASSYQKPGCWQDIRQYQEVVKNGVNGFLCNRADDWYQNIKRLIDDKVLRKNIGMEAFNTIKDWTIQGHIKDYKYFFGNLLTK